VLESYISSPFPQKERRKYIPAGGILGL